MMGEILACCGKYLEIGWFDRGGTSLRFADLAVDPRGLGSEIELLPTGDLAGVWEACRHLLALQPSCQAGNTPGARRSRVTTLAGGQSPRAGRSSACAPRRRVTLPRSIGVFATAWRCGADLLDPYRRKPGRLAATGATQTLWEEHT
jgi:hypothetical protein